MISLCTKEKRTKENPANGEGSGPMPMPARSRALPCRQERYRRSPRTVVSDAVMAKGPLEYFARAGEHEYLGIPRLDTSPVLRNDVTA
jgi:hypothetical protein